MEIDKIKVKRERERELQQFGQLLLLLYIQIVWNISGTMEVSWNILYVQHVYIIFQKKNSIYLFFSYWKKEMPHQTISSSRFSLSLFSLSLFFFLSYYYHHFFFSLSYPFLLPSSSFYPSYSSVWDTSTESNSRREREREAGQQQNNIDWCAAVIIVIYLEAYTHERTRLNSSIYGCCRCCWSVHCSLVSFSCHLLFYYHYFFFQV